MPEITADIVSTMRHPVLVLGQDLEVILANRAFLKLFDVSSGETVGRSLTDLGEGQWDIPELRRALDEMCDRRSEIEDFRVEQDFPGIGRRQMLLNARCLPRDGDRQQILLAIEDVTERRRSREALAASEERLRQVLETEAIGVIFFDGEGRLVGANDVFLRWSGYGRDEIEGGRLHWRDFTPEEWVAISEEQMERLAETGHLGPYQKEYLHKDGTRSWMLFVGRSLDDGTVVEYCIDISDWKRAEREREMLAQELAHRVKNTLGVIQSLATQTAEYTDSVEQFQRVFLGRLQALAEAHSLLMDATWQGADLAELVARSVEAYRVDHPDVVRIEGESVEIGAKQALGLSLILHELGTNAAKYGALSRHEGRLHVTWAVGKAGHGREIRLEWRERHGPEVTPPDHRGFGTELIEGAYAYELDGEAEMDFAPEGLTCRISFPLDGRPA